MFFPLPDSTQRMPQCVRPMLSPFQIILIDLTKTHNMAAPTAVTVQPGAIDERELPQTYLVLSIFSCVCCNFCCLGLIAMIFGISANSSLNIGNVSFQVWKFIWVKFDFPLPHLLHRFNSVLGPKLGTRHMRHGE